MRALRRLTRPAVATAAAVLLLSGCGDDDNSDSSSASSSSSSSSSSAPSSSAGSSEGSGGGDAEAAEFCEQAASFDQLDTELSSATPDELGPILQQAADEIASVEAPAEISADWQTLVGALQQFADTISSTDFTTPEGQAAVEQAVTEFTTAGETAGANIDAYVSENCA